MPLCYPKGSTSLSATDPSLPLIAVLLRCGRPQSPPVGAKFAEFAAVLILRRAVRLKKWWTTSRGVDGGVLPELRGEIAGGLAGGTVLP